MVEVNIVGEVQEARDRRGIKTTRKIQAYQQIDSVFWGSQYIPQ